MRQPPAHQHSQMFNTGIMLPLYRPDMETAIIRNGRPRIAFHIPAIQRLLFPVILQLTQGRCNFRLGRFHRSPILGNLAFQIRRLAQYRFHPLQVLQLPQRLLSLPDG